MLDLLRKKITGGKIILGLLLLVFLPVPKTICTTDGDNGPAGREKKRSGDEKSEARKGSAKEALISRIAADAELAYYQLRMETPLRFPNKEIERLHRLFVTYDGISMKRFGRTVIMPDCQNPHAELFAHIMKSRWYREFLVPITSQPVYDYAEDVSLRIIISTHIAAHYFDLPYPILICLIFQESKFDMKILSPTGALGIGQLTSIAIEQIDILRRIPAENNRLMDAAERIRQAYRDPVLIPLLRRMGFKPHLPDLGKFPDRIRRHRPPTKDLVRDVALEIERRGYDYGRDTERIRRLVERELRGEVLSGDDAAVHPAVLDVMDAKYGRIYGNVFNLETNLLASAMLLRHYYDYPWRINGEKVRMRPCLRSLLAVAAYNQGPTPVERFMNDVAADHPEIELDSVDAGDLEFLFTKPRISKSLRQNRRRTTEIYHHVVRIRDCFEKGFTPEP